MCFVGNLILSSSCEFYYDDTMTSFICIKFGDVPTEIFPQRAACSSWLVNGQPNLMQIRFILRCVQYMATCVLQSEQYTSDVRKCLVGKNLHSIPRCNQSFFSSMHSAASIVFLHLAFKSLLTDRTNVLANSNNNVEN